MNFKFAKVKGIQYLQIWDDGVFVCSCGNAEKLKNKLVRLNQFEKQTNKKPLFWTNFSLKDYKEND